MAYKSNFGKNPFEDEDENDDSFHDLSTDPDLLSLKQQQDYYRNQMVQSSNRSVRMVVESQSTAMETAEELRKQREQLERTSKNLDKINGDLDQSDRNITSLKSIWGTMSNWFRKPIPKNNQSNADNRDKSSEDDDKRLETQNKELQENLKKLDKTVDSAYQSGSSSRVYGAGFSDGGSGTAEDQIVDQNLDALLAGLTVLKSQGLALGNEIDESNTLIDEITKKSEGADLRIENQNQRMNKILRR